MVRPIRILCFLSCEGRCRRRGGSSRGCEDGLVIAAGEIGDDGVCYVSCDVVRIADQAGIDKADVAAVAGLDLGYDKDLGTHRDTGFEFVQADLTRRSGGKGGSNSPVFHGLLFRIHVPVNVPTSDIGAMPLAVLAVETMEEPLERVRYRLRYGVDWIEEVPGSARAPISYVEVIRFNLGPAIRQDLIESLGAEHVAGPEEFGVGAHVAWRFVTRPLMGNRATGVAAGRGVVPDEAARSFTCLGTPCLSPHTSIDDAAPWSEMEPAEVALHSLFAEHVGGNLTRRCRRAPAGRNRQHRDRYGAGRPVSP